VKTAEGYLEKAKRHKAENDNRLVKWSLLSAATYFFFAARLFRNPLKQQYFRKRVVYRAGQIRPDKNQKILIHQENEVENNLGSFLMQEKPNITIDDVAGLDDVKEKLRGFYKRGTPELLEKWKVKLGGGLLLFVSPGVGKMFITKATAGEYDAFSTLTLAESCRSGLVRVRNGLPIFCGSMDAGTGVRKSHHLYR